MNNLQIEILNPEALKDLFKNWGQVASVCYDTKTSKPEIIGKHCMKSGHTSGSRGDYIIFKITDIPRFTIDQITRHEIGTFKNVQSFRYVDKDNFAYEIPKEIEDNNDLVTRYIVYMTCVTQLYSDIQKYVLKKTNNKERANEQARYVLPMATHGALVMGFTVEALIHFMHKRLCGRAEDIIRKLAIEMKKETLKYLPDLQEYLVPQCEYLLWCPEEKGNCGRFPLKEDLQKKLKSNK